MYIQRSHTPWRWTLCTLVAVIPVVTIMLVSSYSSSFVRADVNTTAHDLLRTSWYPDQSNLTPGLLKNGAFGQIFNAKVDGQVYAQPLVSKGMLLVATENNAIYGLDQVTGQQKWTRNLGRPFNPAEVTCSDLVPNVGITGTPVIDPVTNIAYFIQKTYLPGGNDVAAQYMHAVNVTTGAEQSGFPVLIQGTAANDTTHSFNAKMELQRPGLLLLNGVVYAAFGSHCIRQPYEGWLVGVSTAGKITTLWTDGATFPVKSNQGPGSGIWMSGAAPISDGANQIVLTTGNGAEPAMNTPGKQAPGTLGQSVVRLAVQTNGSLKATDFFSPANANLLNLNDSDLGSGGPIELPSPYFGTQAYPHLILQAGKQGYLFLMDGNNLGGRGMGPGGTDGVISKIGPNGGLWSKPAVWPGDGGYVYTTTAQGGGNAGNLKVYKYTLDGAGKPTLSLAGKTADTFGFGSSSPEVTSTGTTSGSALVWVIWSPNGTGANAQLRAYDPLPVNGILPLLYSANIGTASKFTSPVIDSNRVYVGTRDGNIIGFSTTKSATLTAPALNFGNTILGTKAQQNLLITAHQAVTITQATVQAPAFQLGTPSSALPVKLSAGQTLSLPVIFQPKAPGVINSSVVISSSAGSTSFTVSGSGESTSGQISASSSSINFGTVPIGEPVSNVVTFTNVGATAVTITTNTLPAAPFQVTGLPSTSTSVSANKSIAATITFTPQKASSYTDSLVLATTGGNIHVTITGTGAAAGTLTVNPLTLNVGNVKVGAKKTATFTVSNTGSSPITLTRSKYPSAGVGFTATSTLAEGTDIEPGTVLTESVIFAPTKKGQTTDSWSFNADDGKGQQTIVFIGKGI